MKKATVTKDASVSDNSMAEIYQSNNTQQALLRRDGPTTFTRLTNFVKCRDFLVDTYSFAKESKDFGIYGFNFKGSKMQPDWAGVYIMVKFDAKSRENFFENMDILHAVEHQNKYDLTQVLELEDDAQHVVVIGDKRWLQNCLSFSLYSLMLRVICYKHANTKDWITGFIKQNASDAKYIGSVPRETLDKVLADLSTIETESFCGFNPKKDGTSTIHHNSGFISVFGWHTEIDPDTVKTNKHWQEMEKRGLKTCVGQKAA